MTPREKDHQEQTCRHRNGLRREEREDEDVAEGAQRAYRPKAHAPQKPPQQSTDSIRQTHGGQVSPFWRGDDVDAMRRSPRRVSKHAHKESWRRA